MIKPLEKNDNFSVLKKSIFFDVDNYTLLLLYQPILNIKSISLYLTLLNLENLYFYNSKDKYLPHEFLTATLNITIEEFVVCRKLLESVNLLKTYFNEKISDDENGGHSYYNFVLYPPLTPNSFFKRKHLASKLLFSVGEQNTYRIKKMFSVVIPSNVRGNDISSNVEDIMNLREANISQEIEENEYFSRKKTFSSITNIDWLSTILDGKVNEEIIYSSKLAEMIDIMYYVYNFKYTLISSILFESISNKKVDYKKLKRICNKYIQNQLINYQFDENSDNTSEITGSNYLHAKEQMLKYNNFEYFVMTYKETPTQGILQQLSNLTSKYNLSYEIINCLLDYSYIKNKKYVINYIEKIAITINEKNLYNISDLMNHLNKYIRKNRYVVDENQDIEDDFGIITN